MTKTETNKSENFRQKRRNNQIQKQLFTFKVCKNCARKIVRTIIY